VPTSEEPSRCSSPRASILIVDDVAEWRNRLRELLRVRPEWEIVGEARDGLEAVHRVMQLSPDLVLLDIGMPVLNGLEAAARIRRASSRTKIVFVTQDNDADLWRAALAAGAEGYVLKANAASELLPTITAALLNRSRPT